jgi:hypothetical protein
MNCLRNASKFDYICCHFPLSFQNEVSFKLWGLIVGMSSTFERGFLGEKPPF